MRMEAKSSADHFGYHQVCLLTIAFQKTPHLLDLLQIQFWIQLLSMSAKANVFKVSQTNQKVITP